MTKVTHIRPFEGTVADGVGEGVIDHLNLDILLFALFLLSSV